MILSGAAATAVGLSCSSARAVFRSWNVGTGNWGTASNWDPAGVPTSSDIVFLNHLVSGVRGVVTVSGTGFASPVSISIRQLNELDIANHSSLGVGGDVFVGYDSSVGFLNINSSQPGVVFFDGQMTVGNTLRLGYGSSSGQVNQNDGTMTVNQLVRVGDRQDISPIFPGTGRYNLSGVGVLNAARLEIGYGGDAGTFACEGEFNLSGNAVLNISLGAQIPDPKIGGNGAAGTLNQSGGTVNSPFRIINVGQGTSGSGIYNFSGGTLNTAGLFISGNGTINYTGGSNLNTGQLSTTDGHVLLGSGGGKVLRASLLFTSAGAWAIDLNDNAAIINTTLGETVSAAIHRGYNNGAWNGNGITSSAAASAAGSAHPTALGYGTADELGISSFEGFSVAGTTNLIKYTFAGDSNLDGKVDVTDLGALATNWQTGANWSGGDFNYDGFVDVTDLGVLATNWQQGATGPAAGGSLEAAMASVGLSGATVPEPGTLLMMISATALTIGSRVRRRPQPLA